MTLPPLLRQLARICYIKINRTNRDGVKPSQKEVVE